MLKTVILSLTLCLLGLGRHSLVQALDYPAVSTNQGHQIAINIVSYVSMSCDPSASLAIPAGVGDDISPVACNVLTNGTSGYLIDVLTSPELVGTTSSHPDAFLSQLNSLAGIDIASPVALNDGTHNAWGVYHQDLSTAIPCSNLSTTAPVWGTYGTIINSSTSGVTSDSYKFCVGASLSEAQISDNYEGLITFTITTID
ncbi:hypothetical protein FWH30_00745 [Microgenomates group bacterium]|nr:hypothetical protein [Microgenomates group bacterium]